MKLVKPSIEFLNMTPEPLLSIERAGRTCYKSEDKITKGSAEAFVKMLLDKGHHAMIEHAWASYKVICDRGVSHEIVRHRLFSYAQESTRYCNYKGGITFIIPPWINILSGEYFVGNVLESSRKKDERFREVYENLGHSGMIWYGHLCLAEIAYKDLVSSERKVQWSPQQARSALPNSLKTEIVITGNLREWMHFFKLRTAKTAHPQMQEIANMLLKDMQKRATIVFEEFGKK